MTNARYNIYTKDDVEREDSANNVVVTEEVEFNAKRMDERFLSVTVKNPYPIPFAIGDKITWRGETFVLNSLVGVKKQSSRGKYGEAFVYENMRFGSYVTNTFPETEFLDTVLYDNGVFYTSLKSVAFFAENYEDLLDRIQANVGTDFKIFSPSKTRSDRRGITAEEWEKVYGSDDTDPEYEVTKQNVVIDNGNCWSALLLVRDTFKARFSHKGKMVIVDGPNEVLETLRYGKDNGLYEIERVSDPDQDVTATHLRVFGSSDNLPVRYYHNMQMTPFVSLNSMVEDTTDVYAGWKYARYSLIKFDAPYLDSQWCYDKINGDGQDFPWTDDGDYKEFVHRIIFKNGGVVGTWFWVKDCQIQAELPTGTIYNAKLVHVYTEEYSGETAPEHFASSDKEYLLIAYGISGDTSIPPRFYDRNPNDPDSSFRVAYVESGVKKSEWPIMYMFAQDSGVVQDNMAVLNLMLPGFPTESLYDWVIANGGTAVDDVRNKEGYYRRAAWSGYDAFFSMNRLVPYIMSLNFSEDGIKPYTLYCDGSVTGVDDIKPSLKDMTIGAIRSSDPESEWGIYKWPSDQRVDEIVSVTEDYETEYADDGIVYGKEGANDVTKLIKKSTGEAHIGKMEKTVYVGVCPLGFNLYDTIRQSGGECHLEFTDGMNGGRSFEISDVEKDDDMQSIQPRPRYIVKLKRIEDNAIERWFPYGGDVTTDGTTITYGYPIKTGDKFVLTGIGLPETYIKAASIRLLEAGLKWLSENCVRRWLYEVKIDEIEMQREQDIADKKHAEDDEYEPISLYEKIDADKVFAVFDPDIGGSIVSRVESVSIKETMDGLPTYTVTLRHDDKLNDINISYPRIFNEKFSELYD